MSYLSQKLITNALYLTGICSVGFQSPTSSQMSIGLDQLNFVLANKYYDTNFIPYFSEYEFTAVTGQEKYFIPNLVELDCFVFYIGNVRFPVQYFSRNRYQGTARADNVKSIPIRYTVERCKGGTNLYLYFSPYTTLEFKLWGKFAPEEVELNTDLAETFDLFYIDYLTHELAIRLSNFFGIPLRPQLAITVDDMRNKLRDITMPDLSSNNISLFGNEQGAAIEYTNLWRGFNP